MADNTYDRGFYREQGGNRAVVASSGSLDVESGGEIDIESGGRLEIGGTPLITSGGKVDLSSTANFVSGNFYTTGTVKANSGVTSTGTGTFNAVTSTGTITGNGFVSTGSGGFSSTGSGVAGKFDAVTSTGTGTFNAVTSTGTGTFNAVTSTGTGTFNAVTSTGTGTFNAVSSTGAGTFDSITTTGGTAGTIKGQRITANTGYEHFVENLTSSAASIVAYGVTYLNASTTLTMPLDAPVANVVKWIAVQTTGATVTITSTSAGADIGGSTQAAISTGTAVAPAWLHLIGRNSTSWRVLGVSANVSIT